MTSASGWGWLTGQNRIPHFIDDIISAAHAAIGKTNLHLPRRYTGHSLGGALAMQAYIKYGRDIDLCHVFSPYMYLFLAQSIRQWPKRNPIVVWAHKDDPFWKTGWGNYDRENPDGARLIWHDTSDGVAATSIIDPHYLENMVDYFTEPEVDYHDPMDEAIIEPDEGKLGSHSIGTKTTGSGGLASWFQYRNGT